MRRACKTATRRLLAALTAFLALVMAALPGCEALSEGGYDSAAVYSDAVALISEKMGADAASAEEIYRLLRESGLEPQLSFVTVWTDFDTGEKYYRVTANGSSRNVYLTEDGRVALIKNGENICYRDPSAASGTDAPEPETIAETETPETKPPETKPAETKPPETKPTETKPTETKPADTKPAEIKPPETTAAADPGDSKRIAYVLNTNTKKFHYPSCRHVKSIKEKNRADYTGTRDDLISQGYSPCGTCKP